MKIFHAAVQTHHYEWVRNALLSFYYDKEELSKPQNFENLFMDSGAFTMDSKGVKIDLEEYAEFIKKVKSIHGNNFIYANLDVITDYKKTLENQRKLENLGVNPIPVFHSDEPLELLEYYCQNYKYIALGWLTKYRNQKDKLRSTFDQMFSVIKKYFPIKVHGFGISNWEFLFRYPFYSVDSTTWKMGEMVRAIRMFQKYRMKLIYFSDKQLFNSFIPYPVHRKEDYKLRSRLNISQWDICERFITNLWCERGIKWSD